MTPTVITIAQARLLAVAYEAFHSSRDAVTRAGADITAAQVNAVRMWADMLDKAQTETGILLCGTTSPLLLRYINYPMPGDLHP